VVVVEGRKNWEFDSGVAELVFISPGVHKKVHRFYDGVDFFYNGVIGPSTMSRGKSNTGLPLSLQKELGIQLKAQRERQRSYAKTPQRRANSNRIEKKQVERRGNSTRNERFNRPILKQKSKSESAEESESESDREHHSRARNVRPTQRKATGSQARAVNGDASESEDDEEFLESASRESSPALVLDPESRSYKERLARDDDEIAALERRLGLKGKKSSKAFADEGLDDLLGGLDSGDEDRKRKREEKEWLESKRRRKQQAEVDEAESESNATDELISEDEWGGLSSDDDDEVEDKYEEDAFASNDEEDPDLEPLQQSKVRENPYVPPIAPSASSAKYIPPSLRKPAHNADENLARLKRQVQGHLNKLSEANLISILSEIEKLYRDNPRQDVTSTLIDLLLSLISNHATLQSTFILLHAAFCSAVYKVIGTDFGAELLARVTESFQQHHNDDAGSGKEALNLISFLAHLFTFQVTASGLIYSYINLLTESLTESNTELLLRIIRDCGPQLRSDDPAALKAVVSQTQAAAQKLSRPTVRTQFMLEIITDLKNNKMRNSTSNSAMTKEHITKLRKALGSLNSSNRTLRATEPLRLTLDDLLNTDRRGKWWLVGASWRGTSPPPTPSNASPASNQPHSTEVDINTLSHHIHLTTPLHTTILSALLSSPTPLHAFTALTKLRLKKSQLPQIPHVILRCAGAEETFNKFYSDVSIRLCNGEDGKRFQKAFEFALWAFFKRIGDGNDDFGGNEGGGDVGMREVLSTAKLYAELLCAKNPSSGVTVNVLRPIELPLLARESQASLFVEVMFVQVFIMCQGKSEDVRRIFGAVKGGVGMGVRLFLENVVKGSDLLGKEKKVVRKGVRVAMGVLERVGREEGEGGLEHGEDDW
jgi:nucleolar MIF4G domain-containing protein 1